MHTTKPVLSVARLFPDSPWTKQAPEQKVLFESWTAPRLGGRQELKEAEMAVLSCPLRRPAEKLCPPRCAPDLLRREVGRSRRSSAPLRRCGDARAHRARLPLPLRTAPGLNLPSAGSRSPFYIIGRAAAAAVTQQRGERGLPARLGGKRVYLRGRSRGVHAGSLPALPLRGSGGGGREGARPGPASRPLRPTASPARARGSPPLPPDRAELAAPP